MGDTSNDLIDRYSAALLRIIATGDDCQCDRHGGCGCGLTAANIARDALTAKPAPKQPRKGP
jgi:hypothetical protein